MSYDVRIIRSAEKDMERIPAVIHARINKKILSLEDEPRPRGIKKLTGKEEYRLRTGDYRILYTIDDKKKSITIVAVGHRREIYG